MNDPFAQYQQQLQALEANLHQQTVFAILFSVALVILGGVGGFFYTRWFLLHVFEIQQKLFFTQLDMFLHQRGIAPHVPEPPSVTKATSPGSKPAAHPTPIKSAVRDLAAEVDSLIAQARPPAAKAHSLDRTPFEQAWEDLSKLPGSHRPEDPDARFKPKG